MQLRSFYSASLLLLVFNNLAAALNYVFQALMARHLSPADFGLMNSLFSMMGFLSLPLTVYTNLLVRQWAELTNQARHEEAEQLWCALFVAAALLSFTLVLVGFCFIPAIAWWLQTTNLTAVALTVAGMGITVVVGLANPLATARQWFLLIAAASLTGGLVRIGLAWTGIRLSTPLSGAVVATCLYGGVLLAAMVWRIRWPARGSWNFQRLISPVREWRGPLLFAVATFCLTSADLLVIRRLYTTEQTGVFAQVIVLGKIMIFLIGPIATVVLPKAAGGGSLLSTERGVVRRALLLGALILGAAALVISWFAPVAVFLLRGTVDPEVVRLLRIAVWCLAPLSLNQLILPALFARRQERQLFEFTALALLLPLALACVRDSLVAVFLVEGLVGIVLLGFSVWRIRSLPARV